MVRTQATYFVERDLTGRGGWQWQVRENHEKLFNIKGGSGLVKTFQNKQEADAYAAMRNRLADRMDDAN